MSDPAILAIIGSTQVVLVLLVQGVLAGRRERRASEMRQAEKKLDYARQDEVARRADVAAARLLESQNETTAILETANNSINTQLHAIDEQGKKIHILVNSDMTAARTNERDQVRLHLVALRRLQALTTERGLPEDLNDREAIKVAEERILQLDAILADRLAAQAAVDAEAQAETKEKP